MLLFWSFKGNIFHFACYLFIFSFSCIFMSLRLYVFGVEVVVLLKFLAPTWDEIYFLTFKVARMILEDGVNFDVIVGIARGGWIVARMMSDLLSIKKVASITVEFYSDIGEKMEEPVVSQPISIDVQAKRVLLCDDVADSGHSLRVAINHLKDNGVTSLKVATLHLKPWSVVTPDYYGEVTDAWIIYPWELFESVESLSRKFEAKGWTRDEIERFLLNIPIPLKYLDPLLKWREMFMLAWRGGR